MAWSISLIGLPEKVAEELDKESGRMTGQPKIEFDDAKPHIQALIKQNFVNANAPGFVQPIVKLDASGSGIAQGTPGDARQVSRSCQVKIETFFSKLLV